MDAGSDGVTHQLTEDISIFRCIPNLKLFQPADANEMKQMVNYVNIYGPMIIKSGKSESLDVHIVIIGLSMVYHLSLVLVMKLLYH